MRRHLRRSIQASDWYCISRRIAGFLLLFRFFGCFSECEVEDDEKVTKHARVTKSLQSHHGLGRKQQEAMFCP